MAIDKYLYQLFKKPIPETDILLLLAIDRLDFNGCPFPFFHPRKAMILRMDHFTIVTDQLEQTRQFYVDLLGLELGPRPPFPVDGLWLYSKGHAVLHVILVAKMPNPRRGVLDHMAFAAEGLSSTLDKLDQHAIRYRIIRAPGEIRTWQVFFRDPNDVEVELDFAPAEQPPPDWKERSKL